MQRELKRLADEQFDVLVIGGGITGSCICHDAALRGLSVALVERGDFAGATSSASSKLLHGGIRYLAKAQFGKVRESAREQAIFQVLAPHLTRWVPFLIPTEKSAPAKGALAMRAAMRVYSLCCAGLSSLVTDPAKQQPQHRFLSAREAVQNVPLLHAIPGLTGAQILYESHMHSSERMCLAFLKSAAGRGAAIANYLEVRKYLTRNGRVEGVRVQNRLDGQEFDIRARLVVNAAGPFVQKMNQTLPSLRLHHPLTGFSRGVHLVTRQIEPEYALALTTGKKTEGLITRGGRHFFIIPWRGHSLIGTTNVPVREELTSIRVTEQDVEEFLADINSSLPDINLEVQDVKYAFTGLYPIIARRIKPDTYQGTGEYQIVDHAQKDGVEGCVTALGAKYTTARHVAARTVDLVFRKLEETDPGCSTDSVPLDEGNIQDMHAFREQCRQQYGSCMESELVDHLLINHGCEIDALVRLGREQGLLEPVAAGRSTLKAEIIHAISHEMACTLEDIVFRRTGLGTIGHPGRQALQWCARVMAGHLGWSDEETKQQLDQVEQRYVYR